MLALQSGAPILPLAYYGSERFRSNFTRLRRTDFHMRVGEPFTLRPQGQRPSSLARQSLTDQIMYQLAVLLPPVYRGAYTDLSRMSHNELIFLTEPLYGSPTPKSGPYPGDSH